MALEVGILRARQGQRWEIQLSLCLLYLSRPVAAAFSRTPWGMWCRSECGMDNIRNRMSSLYLTWSHTSIPPVMPPAIIPLIPIAPPPPAAAAAPLLVIQGRSKGFLPIFCVSACVSQSVSPGTYIIQRLIMSRVVQQSFAIAIDKDNDYCVDSLDWQNALL